ncbi:uncharacterized protein Z519_03199 [Cladophialophora bantiana CBS 173.52]|uniref:Apple domain-containing protein n=1 Tax=Cladophialophora bantiana (strain ATCC 10958 / CBS 173.52 / CDC B-1940 / NIH 8579) TaxID=1442370 RepID=A0A0D2GCC4_CLAB1|nr:uncharacterized protein Z519_03199 [Cladophialophora bantiana CBS 173.52]KIW96132.1 hypothetical protein Z519_03199 [Cladophialophora bantiana CBS 173.52]
MASPPSAEALSSVGNHSSYSDKQVVSSVDHGKEVVTQTQPYPDAYGYANPNNTNNDSSNGGGGGGGLEVFLENDQEKPAWSEQKTKRKICGLSTRAFIIVVAVVTALMVAAIIGGSVGGVLASKNSSGSARADLANTSSTSLSTTQPTAVATIPAPTVPTTPNPATPTTPSPPSLSTSTASTSTAPTSTATTSASGEGSYNCPADNNTDYVSPLLSTATWTILCDTDWPSGVDAFSGGTVTDLTAVVAYSIDACIDQCAAYNVAGGDCEAVVYGANITLALSRGGIQGNCFLKSDRGAKNTADNSGQVEAAYLSGSS